VRTCLLAVRGRQDVADGRRRRWRGAARQQGRQVRATRLARAAWAVLVPTGPADRLVLREALVRGGVRWQMAWLCQVGKSPGGVDASRRTKPWRVLGEGSAQLRAMLRQHGLCRGSCWAYPKRSLGKAAQTVRKEALRLASALHGLLGLTPAITTSKRCRAVGCRMNRRRKPPHTDQLWLDATCLSREPELDVYGAG
jgi:hypothetical protein